jgi:hypothetical protein
VTSFSFFLEAPRPITWEDGGDLEKVWKFYSLVRPDMLIYEGTEINIVDPQGDIPIKRPDYIVEYKELPNWWKRWRYLKDYKPLDGNEWRARWLKGLYEGFAEILGVEAKDLPSFSEGKSKRIKEYKVIELYEAIYKPRKGGIVISRVPVVNEVKNDISSSVVLIEDVGFNQEKLEIIIEKISKGVRCTYDIKDLAYEFAMSRKEEFINWMKSQGIIL